MDGIKGAVLFADSAGAIQATPQFFFTWDALFAVFAVYNNLLGIRHISNDSLRTSLDAKPRRQHIFRVNHGKTLIVDMNGIKRAHPLTGARNLYSHSDTLCCHLKA